MNRCIQIVDVIESLNRMADFNDVTTEDHAKGTRRVAALLSRALNIKGDMVQFIEWGADIHDIGKLAIHPDLLNKAAKLTRAQFASVQQHCEYGYEMIQPLHLPGVIEECVRLHHEHYDGSGYFKMHGDDIPLHVQILCLADVWEAVNSNRPYRSAFTRQQAKSFMKKHSSWFGPKVYKSFTDLVEDGVL